MAPEKRTDLETLHEFSLEGDLKRKLYMALLSLFAVLCLGLFAVLYLSDALEESREEEAFSRNQYSKIKHSHDMLYATMLQAQQDLFDKEEALGLAHQRMMQIEERIGLAATADASIETRIEKAELTSEVMARLLSSIPNGSPVIYEGITSKYGSRMHPKLKKPEFHRGVDLKAAMHTPVYATAEGVVEYAGFHKASGYGTMVIVDHNYGFRTFFGHLDTTTVLAGDFITKGTLIGYSGNSGLSSGPHLHYEIRFLQHTLNPDRFIKWDLQHYDALFEKEKGVPWKSLIATVAREKVPQSQHGALVGGSNTH